MCVLCQAKYLYGQLATAGTDFLATAEANVSLANGDASGLIPIFILPDNVPELSKKFLVQLTGVELISADVVGNPNYRPLLGNVTKATVYIAANDYPHGLFIVYGKGPLIINAEQQRAVQLFIERTGTSIKT
jgi:hypothetical protein